MAAGDQGLAAMGGLGGGGGEGPRTCRRGLGLELGAQAAVRRCTSASASASASGKATRLLGWIELELQRHCAPSAATIKKAASVGHSGEGHQVDHS